MKTEKLESKDALIDTRHNLGTSIELPKEDDSLTILFCDNCRGMVTEWEIRRFGCCPRCRGHKIRGGWETPWERIKLLWWTWTNNWRITGKWKRNGTPPKGNGNTNST